MTKLMHSELSSDSEGTKPITSSAAALIQIAAYRIDLPQGTLEGILDRLRDECIKEEWQLKFIDSYNWQALGAPIGLVAALRSCLQEKNTSTCTCSCSSSLDRCVSDETPKIVTATQISRPTSQTMLSSSPAAPQAPELKARYSVPVFASAKRSNGGIPSELSKSVPILRHSMPGIPARRNTMLLDDAFFENLKALDVLDVHGKGDFDDNRLPQMPQRRGSDFQASLVRSSVNSLDISDFLETDDDASVKTFPG